MKFECEKCGTVFKPGIHIPASFPGFDEINCPFCGCGNLYQVDDDGAVVRRKIADLCNGNDNKEKEDSQQAFPVFGGNQFGYIPGITQRDYFAGQALVGLSNMIKEHNRAAFILLADHAYKIADAMITERTRKV